MGRARLGASTITEQNRSKGTTMDHHYLPKFYLKKWAATDGTVLRYYRLVLPTGDKIIEKRVGPRGAGFEPGLYAVAPGTDWESYDENIVETDVMSPIDDAAAVVLDKMLSDAPSLDSDDRTAWAIFLNSLIHRHRDPVSVKVVVASFVKFL